MEKSWKDKIIDFFYKEIEEEVEESTNVDDMTESLGIEKYRFATIDHQVDRKVKFQYPKKGNASFRFPVIPDDDSIPLSHRGKSKGKYPSQLRNRSSIKRNDFLIHGFHKKQTEKELDEIPAYMRRRNHKEKRPDHQVNTKQPKETTKEEPLQAITYSKPDELDEVFKKRDGKVAAKMHGSHIESQDSIYTYKRQRDHDNRDMEKYTLQKSIPKVQHKPESNDRSFSNNVSKIVQEDSVQVNDDEKKTAHTENLAAPAFQPEYRRIQQKTVPNHLLDDPFQPSVDDEEWIIEQQILLEDTLTNFHIDATVVNVTQGPQVTRFEIQPALGVKVSKIKNLADDIKLNLAAKDIRIEAPIPGKNTIGIEVPNLYPQVVSLQEIIESPSFQSATSPLTIALGLTIEGAPLITNIEKMPHGLIAGATGSGKSVCINTIILSLLYKANHDEVKLLLIDPKMVELTPYNEIPHLLAPVITDVKAATQSLKWAVAEMESRYEKFVDTGVRNIQKYNEKISQDASTSKEKMPYIVIIIDELADLMMVSPQDVEDAICRIAQKARACGIHLLLATQRPSVDVITGLIKANIPTRIAFSVSSQVDSRTIIDNNGADKLLGKGDMLFVENGSGKSIRLQGPFVADEEIDRVASYVRSIAKPHYLFEQNELLHEMEEEEEDDLLPEVIDFVLEQNQASTSLLQRRFRIGYNRAARLIDYLEQKGIVSAQNGSKPRDILISK